MTLNIDSIWIIVIFVIIIILLLLKLFDVNIDFFTSTDTSTIDFKPRGDGKIKGNEDDTILDSEVNISHSQTSKDYSNTKSEDKVRDEGKSELGNDNSIVPEQTIGLQLKTEDEQTNKEYPVYENKGTNYYKLVDETVDNRKAMCADEIRKYEVERQKEEMRKRYDNQNKEYKKAFGGKNELDYDGNVITDENIYQFDDFTYINANQIYIPTDYKTSPEDYGRNYIPPELWYKNNRRLNLPVCVPANSRCTVKETLTSGYPLDVIEWHESRKVMNPDGINIDYVKQKLNTNSDIGVIEGEKIENVEIKEEETKN